MSLASPSNLRVGKFGRMLARTSTPPLGRRGLRRRQAWPWPGPHFRSLLWQLRPRSGSNYHCSPLAPLVQSHRQAWPYLGAHFRYLLWRIRPPGGSNFQPRRRQAWPVVGAHFRFPHDLWQIRPQIGSNFRQSCRRSPDLRHRQAWPCSGPHFRSPLGQVRPHVGSSFQHWRRQASPSVGAHFRVHLGLRQIRPQLGSNFHRARRGSPDLRRRQAWPLHGSHFRLAGLPLARWTDPASAGLWLLLVLIAALLLLPRRRFRPRRVRFHSAPAIPLSPSAILPLPSSSSGCGTLMAAAASNSAVRCDAVVLRFLVGAVPPPVLSSSDPSLTHRPSCVDPLARCSLAVFAAIPVPIRFPSPRPVLSLSLRPCFVRRVSYDAVPCREPPWHPQ